MWNHIKFQMYYFPTLNITLNIINLYESIYDYAKTEWLKGCWIIEAKKKSCGPQY